MLSSTWAIVLDHLSPRIIPIQLLSVGSFQLPNSDYCVSRFLFELFRTFIQILNQLTWRSIVRLKTRPPRKPATRHVHSTWLGNKLQSIVSPCNRDLRLWLYNISRCQSRGVSHHWLLVSCNALDGSRGWSAWTEVKYIPMNWRLLRRSQRAKLPVQD